MLYMLPTGTAKRYTGKYPNRIAMVSYSSKSFDIDGNACVHVETNCGERFTISRDRIENLNAPIMGQNLTDICKNGTVLNTMTQEAYDTWLAGIRAEREANRKG